METNTNQDVQGCGRGRLETGVLSRGAILSSFFRDGVGSMVFSDIGEDINEIRPLAFLSARGSAILHVRSN